LSPCSGVGRQVESGRERAAGRFRCLAASLHTMDLRLPVLSGMEQASDMPAPASVRPEDLAARHGNLREDLGDSLQSLDHQRITQVPISPANRLVGVAVQSLADNLTYSPILPALRGAASSVRGGTT
jgi:hypothetical protein